MKNFWIATLFLFTLSSAAQTISIVGDAYRHIPEVSSGLAAVYVVPAGATVSLRYESASASEIRWYRFGDGGIAARVEMLGTQSGNISTLSGAERGYGYMTEQDGAAVYVWVAAYKSIASCSVDESWEDVCETLCLQGEGFAIPYCTTNGRVRYMPREVRYTTAVWDEENQSIRNNETRTASATVLSDSEMTIPAPCGYSSITVIDPIPASWGGVTEEIPAGEYDSPAILMRAVAEQRLRGADNEAAEIPVSGFGGSAPVEMTFTAYVNGNNYYAWEFSYDPDFSIVETIYPVEVLEYAFREEGTTYVRLHAYNDYCERDTVFEIHVGESKLEAPNAFSPYGSPGINDEWKVAYKSIVNFKCWIFNRWGEQLFYYEDPASGWDGRYRGKLVPPGVYYYVIEARGADGRKYKLKGHINILKSKERNE